MPAPNQPIFRSNALKHYMEGREKHEVPRFISLPITILLWVLLASFVTATALVWSEQVPTYVTDEGMVVVQSAAQFSGKSVPTTGKQGSAMDKSASATKKSVPAAEKPGFAMGQSASATEKSVPAAEKPIPPMTVAVFFISPAQVHSLHIGMPVRLHVGLSGLQFVSKITNISPGAMSPVALRSLFHLENVSPPITQPSAVIMVKLDPAFATAYAGSALTADIQVGSQSLISLLPGVGSLFRK